MPKNLELTETVLRDGQEALIGARMTTSEITTILPILDRVGYRSIDVFGGYSFDVCLRHLQTDPWKRLHTVCSNITRTKRQMTVRGQNLVGYRNYPDDIVQYFVQRAIANGIDIVRVYDPLNDIRNTETVIRTAKHEGKHVQGAICYTVSPVHSTDAFLDYTRQLLSAGADSICIQDVSGLLRPYEAYQLLKALRAQHPSLHIQFHTRETTGMGAMTILKAIDLGLDAIDVAMSPFASGNSLPATEAMVAAFRSTPYEPTVDTQALEQATEYFTEIRNSYAAEGALEKNFLKVDPTVLQHQIPSGIYSRLLAEICRYNGEDVLKKVLDEIPSVRNDAGYPPLVSPILEILGTQALYNVVDGVRYKRITPEFEALIAGKYGKTPAPIASDVQKTILGTSIPITHRPADALEPMVEFYRAKVAPYAEQEEDLLTLALFGEVAAKYFERHNKLKYHIGSHANPRSATHPV